MRTRDPVTLDGYRTIARRWPVFTLHTDTGSHQVRYAADQRAARAMGSMVGMADLRRMGGWLWGEVGLVAVYARAGRLYLWINGAALDLMDDDVIIRRQTDIWLRKRFTVRAGGRTVCDVRYSHPDWEQLPDADIFWYIARSLGTLPGRVRALVLFEDQLTGRESVSGEYLPALDQRVSD